MKTQSQVIAALVLAASSLAAPAGAETGPGLIIVKVSGDRGWTMSCVFEREGKAPIEKSSRGRGRVETLSARDSTRGSCNYEGPREGAIQIRFTDESDADNCPFARVGEHCIGAVAAGEKGSFSF